MDSSASPDLASWVAVLSTKTVAAAIPAASISRWSARGGAPTAFRWSPGWNHAPDTIGACDGVRVQTMSEDATTSAGLDSTLTAMSAPTAVRKADKVSMERDQTRI